MFFFKSTVPSIPVEKAFEEIAPHNNIVLLDVRNAHEYEEVHIKDAVLLPLQELEQKIENIVPRKETPIFVYCRTGNRSTKAVQKLIKLGYTNAYNITGGIMEWEQKHFPVTVQK